MKYLRHVALATALGALSALGGGCSGDDSDGGGGKSGCSCNFGSFCEEYGSGCAFLECESDGMNVKSTGPCPQDDVVGVCTCASDDLVTYYTSQEPSPQEDCEFFCDDGVYEAR